MNGQEGKGGGYSNQVWDQGAPGIQNKVEKAPNPWSRWGIGAPGTHRRQGGERLALLGEGWGGEVGYQAQ